MACSHGQMAINTSDIIKMISKKVKVLRLMLMERNMKDNILTVDMMVMVSTLKLMVVHTMETSRMENKKAKGLLYTLMEINMKVNM